LRQSLSKERFIARNFTKKVGSIFHDNCHHSEKFTNYGKKGHSRKELREATFKLRTNFVNCHFYQKCLTIFRDRPRCPLRLHGGRSETPQAIVPPLSPLSLMDGKSASVPRKFPYALPLTLPSPPHTTSTNYRRRVR
jgi:hypothetical protein